jgi:predicted regulator of Ras-like GTPase activity (Roadblock/LC7/MglB family)
VKAILEELNGTLGARGSLVVSRDGLLIAADVSPDVDVERLSALGAAILSDVGRSLAAAGLPGLAQCEVAADEGKAILVAAGPAYLLVLVGPRIELGPGSVEIRCAARRVARAAELTTT